MKDELRRTLRRIDGRGYKAYRDIEGTFDLGEFALHIDHVQGDPFAAPSRFRVNVSMARARIDPSLFASRARRVALEDFIARGFRSQIRKVVRGSRGIGKSGMIAIDAGGQEILERSAVRVDDGGVEARFVVGLPARGRTVLGMQAEEMILGEIPRLVSGSLLSESLRAEEVRRHVEASEDHDALQRSLREKGWAAFVADGAILPRRSGVDDRPPPRGQTIVPFESPPSLAAEVALPNAGTVKGMAIPVGLTLIVGGGFHGKSTLLDAIARGVYPHIPGDGRERVAADEAAVAIRAEDGRAVESVDISPFIDSLPLGKGTERFSTQDASGSTSQAAAIIEAIEVGARLLLIDEDTSATNFMIRDARMQTLVEKEPITPFVDRVRELHEGLGVSTILVAGGAGDFLDVADTVILMDEFHPREVTGWAKEVAEGYPTRRTWGGRAAFPEVKDRRPDPSSFDPRRGRRDVKIGARAQDEIAFGTTEIDLSAVTQIVDLSQTRAIGEIIHQYARRHAAEGAALREGLESVLDEIERRGMDTIAPRPRGDLARPRLYDVAAAINRMRTLKVR